MNSYVYNAEAQLNDGTAVLLDLEARGWADKELLAKTTRFTLLPKPDAPLTVTGRPYPIVVVNIPEGAKPVFRTRVYRKMGVNDGNLLIDFRVYSIGWKRGKLTYWTHVLPSGDIEGSSTDDIFLADTLFEALTRQLQG
jgi:hypothetical protein